MSLQKQMEMTGQELNFVGVHIPMSPMDKYSNFPSILLCMCIGLKLCNVKNHIYFPAFKNGESTKFPYFK